jgi:hypothetical protein
LSSPHFQFHPVHDPNPVDRLLEAAARNNKISPGGQESSVNYDPSNTSMIDMMLRAGVWVASPTTESEES